MALLEIRRLTRRFGALEAVKDVSIATKWAVTLPPTLFLLAFFLVPALIVVVAGFRETGEFGGLAPWPRVSLDAYRFLLGDVIYLEVFARSFLVAALTTLILLASRFAPDVLKAKA